MVRLLSMIGLLAGVVSLVACTLERRAIGRIPIIDLVRDRYGRPRAEDVLAGTLIGASLILGPFLVASALKWTESAPAGRLDAAVLLLGLATLVIKLVWAAFEELIYRGALLPLLARFTNAWVALVVSAALFTCGHLHRSGPGPDAISIAVYMLDGIGFGLAFLATRSLWMPTLWHAAKNAAIWLLFSESTIQLTHGVARVTYTGPALWVGTNGQAGLLDLIVSSLAAILVFIVGRRRIAASGRALAHG